MNNILIAGLAAVILISALIAWIASRWSNSPVIVHVSTFLVIICAAAICGLALLSEADCDSATFSKNERWKCSIHGMHTPVMVTDSLAVDSIPVPDQ